MRNKGEKLQIANIRNELQDITTDPTSVTKMIRGYYDLIPINLQLRWNGKFFWKIQILITNE